MKNITLIVPAAGSGQRMQTEVPKPFLQLAGKTILEHTISCFYGLPGLSQIIIPASKAYVSRIREILEPQFPEAVALHVIEGGAERQLSIQKALQITEGAELVVIHDAVRPFVKKSDIQNCCEVAADQGGAVLGVPVKDTIKKVDDRFIIDQTPERKTLWQAQTPQVFKAEIILEAYRQARVDHFIGTDDASLVERLGQTVAMVRGDYQNIKITYPLDLKLAQLLLEEDHEE